MKHLIKCVAAGCGRYLTKTQAKAWRRRSKRARSGPFCSCECYTDSLKSDRSKRKT